jgi:hypothetical protein
MGPRGEAQVPRPLEVSSSRGRSHFFGATQHATAYSLSQLDALMRLCDKVVPPLFAKPTLQVSQDNDANGTLVPTPLASNTNPAESPATKTGFIQSNGGSPEIGGAPAAVPFVKISKVEHITAPENCAAHIACIANIPAFADVVVAVCPTNCLC